MLAVPGAPDELAAGCPDGVRPTLPHVAVRTLGMPWNLLGSPRRPASTTHSEPVRITNHWLPERP